MKNLSELQSIKLPSLNTEMQLISMQRDLKQQENKIHNIEWKYGIED